MHSKSAIFLDQNDKVALLVPAVHIVKECIFGQHNALILL